MSVPRIAREELAARIAGADLTIVEALGQTYYADAHLPGARNLPHDRVDEARIGYTAEQARLRGRLLRQHALPQL